MKSYYKFFVFIMTAFLNYPLKAQLTPQEAIRNMARGINIGNTMDPPNEGDWYNPPVQEVYFDNYKNAGFTSVRIPITWDKHTDTIAPYTVNPTWMARVEQVVDWGLSRGLFITINAHHETWIKTHYAEANKRDRFDSIWSQISETFKDRSDSLIFEIINEPKGLTKPQTDELNVRILSIIRKTNPTRLVCFSGNEWANSNELVTAAIPDTSDHFLIGYYHSYDPYPFGLEGPGTYGSDADINNTKAKFDQVTNWSVAHNIPVMLSEFGATKFCEYNSRMFYYATVVEQALNHGVAFNAWDDGGYFQIMLRSTNDWNDIKDILMYTYKESPTKLLTTIGSDTTVTLSWTNRTSENDSIYVDRKTAYSDFAIIARLDHEATQYTDPAVTAGDSIFYRLRTRLKDSIDLYSYPVKAKVFLPTGVEFVPVPESSEIFPNPATDEINVTLKDYGTAAKLDVYNLLGENLRSERIINNQDSYDISELRSGTYFFKISSTNNTVVKKVVVK